MRRAAPGGTGRRQSSAAVRRESNSRAEQQLVSQDMLAILSHYANHAIRLITRKI